MVSANIRRVWSRTAGYLLAVFFAFMVAQMAQGAWTYYDNDGSSTYSGTVRNYTGNDKPYHGYITDGNVSIWVYQHDTANHKWTIGAGKFGVDRGNGGGSLRAGISGGSVNGDTISLYAGDIDFSDANDAVVNATGQSDAAFTVIGKRCFYGYPNTKQFSITGVPPTIELIDGYAFKGASGLVKADFRGSVLTTIMEYAFESEGGASEQEFWFPDTLTTLDYRCLAYGPSKRSIHFLGDVPGFTSSAAADTLGTIYAGNTGWQWAYCVNALKYPKWAAQKVGEFNTGHQSWIPSAVRYKNASDEYAVDETTGVVTYPKPFGTTLFGTSNTETYLIQEGFAGESAVPTYSLTAPVCDATTAAFGVTLITLPSGATSATLTVEVATDADFTDIVKTGEVELSVSGATGTITITGLNPASAYYARLSGEDSEGGEGEVGATIAFHTYLGGEGSYWMSNAPSADAAAVIANYVYFLYSSDGAWTIPIRVSGGVWQLGNNSANENDTVYDATITDMLDLSSVETDTGIVLKSVNGCPFYGKAGVKDVRLPASLEALGDQTFALCSGITNVVMPLALKSLGSSRSFRNCSALRAIDLSGCIAVKTISSSTFFNAGLINVDLRPTSVTNIANEAFMNNYSLSEVWLPDTLETVGKNAFAWGPDIRVIHFRNAPPELFDTSNNGPFYPKDTSKRWVYCVDNKAWPAWDALIDSSVPYDSATMRSCIPEGIDESKVIGTTKFGTAGANAILVYEKVKVNNGLFIIVR